MKVETIYTYKLEVSIEEANWLLRQLENPLQGQSIDDETLEDRHIRRNMFDALKHATGYGHR